MYDEETKWYYLQSRYYVPEICRFLSPDSFDYVDVETIGGLNLYAYCNNDPVNYSDPSRCKPKWWQILVAAVVVVAAVVITVATAGAGGLVTLAVGAVLGATVAAGFEMGTQIIQEGSIQDWDAIGMAAFGGFVAGIVSSIPVFTGFGVGSYLGTAFMGGAGSVLGGLCSGSVYDVKTVITAFTFWAIGNVVAKGVEHISIIRQTNKIIGSASAKTRSKNINNYLIENNINPFKEQGHLGTRTVNNFKSFTKEGFYELVKQVGAKKAYNLFQMLLLISFLCGQLLFNKIIFNKGGRNIYGKE